MRLVRYLFKKARKKQPALNVSALKKNLAISNEHFDLIYAPVLDVVVKCSVHLKSQRHCLYKDYVDQLSQVLRVGKAHVSERDKEEHIYNYGVVLCFTCLYLSKFISRNEFILQSQDGNRKKIFLWLDSYEAETLLVSKKRSTEHPRVYMSSVFSILTENIVNKAWLLDYDKVYNDVLLFLHTNGEVGSFNFITEHCNDPYLLVTANVGINTALSSESTPKDEREKNHPNDFDSLLTDKSIPSLDELVAKSAGSSKPNPFDKMKEEQTGKLDIANLPSKENTSSLMNELELLLAGGSETPSELQSEELADKTSDEIEEDNECSGSISSAPSDAPPSELPQYEGDPFYEHIAAMESEEDVSPVDSYELSKEVLDWSVATLADSPNGIGHGVYYVELNNSTHLAFDLDIGLNAFIEQEYAIDSIHQAEEIKRQIIDDIKSSNIWMKQDNNIMFFNLNVDDNVINIIVSERIFSDKKASLGINQS